MSELTSSGSIHLNHSTVNCDAILMIDKIILFFKSNFLYTSTKKKKTKGNFKQFKNFKKLEQNIKVNSRKTNRSGSNWGRFFKATKNWSHSTDICRFHSSSFHVIWVLVYKSLKSVPKRCLWMKCRISGCTPVTQVSRPVPVKHSTIINRVEELGIHAYFLEQWPWP